MSACHKPIQRLFSTDKKSRLDQMLDFGTDTQPTPSLRGVTQDANRRLENVMKQLDEISARIDRLMNED